MTCNLKVMQNRQSSLCCKKSAIYEPDVFGKDGYPITKMPQGPELSPEVTVLEHLQDQVKSSM